MTTKKKQEDCLLKKQADEIFSDELSFNESLDSIKPTEECGVDDCPIVVLARVDRLLKLTGRMAKGMTEKVLENNEILKAHTQTINELSKTQIVSMHEIASNTSIMASSLKEYNEQNRILVDSVVGRKHVPISIFIMVLLLFGIMNLVVVAGITGMQLIVNEKGGFSIWKNSKDMPAIGQPKDSNAASQ